MEKPGLDWVWILYSLQERYKIQIPELDQALVLLDTAARKMGEMAESVDMSHPDYMRLYEIGVDINNYRQSR